MTHPRSFLFFFLSFFLYFFLLAAEGTPPPVVAAPSPPILDHPSVALMYSELETWLEECKEYIEQSTTTIIKYLQMWLAMNEEARRVHYTALQKRYSTGKYAEVAVWVHTQTNSSPTPGGSIGAAS
jgi:hypothetical protein